MHMDQTVWAKSIEDIKQIAFLGRYSKENPAASLCWPLNGIEFNIRCSHLSVELVTVGNGTPNWVAVFCDQALIARFTLLEGQHWYPVLSGMDPSVPHIISIVNDTQPSLWNDMHSEFCALRSDGEMLELPEPAYHFEFVGDSLTSGEGCIGPTSATEWRSIWMGPSRGYAHLVCARMNARGSLLSQSGWGVYCGWDGTRDYNMPRIYDQLCGVVPQGRIPYDFPQKMDVVIINLGTNDVGALHKLPKEEQPARAAVIKEAVSAFLHKIRSHHPEAYLLWVYGMCGQDWIEYIEEGVKQVQLEGDQRVGFAALPPCIPEETGAVHHPGPANHEKAAQVIIAHLRNVLSEKE